MKLARLGHRIKDNINSSFTPSFHFSTIKYMVVLIKFPDIKILYSKAGVALERYSEDC